MRNILQTVRNWARSAGEWFAKDSAAGRAFGVGDESLSGLVINEETALNFSAFYAGVRVLSETVGGLPARVMRRSGSGEDKEAARDHPAFDLLGVEPNPEMTPIVARETMMVHVLTHGDSVSEIVRNGSGAPAEIWPIMPWQWRSDRHPDTRELRYWVAPEASARGAYDNDPVPLDRDDVLHVPGLGFNGLRGKSVVKLARENLGLAIAATKFGAGFFGRGSRASGFIKLPAGKKLSPKARDDVRRQIQQKIGGLDKFHNILVLDDGAEWVSATMPLDDAQYLQTRKFEIVEIARWLRLPPTKLADLSQAKYNNYEQQTLDFVTDSILPWLIRFEQEFMRKLLSRQERREFVIEHLVEGLLRGDIKSRFEAYKIAWMNGWMTQNEIRRRENLPSLGEEGEVIWVPSNMQPAKLVLKKLEEPGPPPADDPPPAEENDDERHFEEKTDDTEAMEDRRRQVAETHRLMVVQELQKIVNRESRAARRAATNARGWNGWIDTWFDSHAAKLCERIEPLAASSCELHGRDKSDAAAIAAEIVESHVARARSELLDVAGRATAQTLPELAGVWADQWEADRPSELAGELITATTSKVTEERMAA